jgi:hypothetical protein
MPVVICQPWMESEREPGWGVTQRPDGYSLHLTPGDHAEYVRRHWAKYPDGPAPNYYTGPVAGAHYETVAGDDTYRRLVRNGAMGGFGIKLEGTPPPRANALSRS